MPLLFICRFGIGVLVERVDELFKGHRDLIFGFDMFLPKGYREAINFLRKIEVKILLDLKHLCMPSKFQHIYAHAERKIQARQKGKKKKNWLI